MTTAAEIIAELAARREQRWRCRNTGRTARVMGVVENHVVWRFKGASANVDQRQ